MSAAHLLFAGTPDFAVASLRALIDAGFSLTAVLTQPDRPSGRGRKLTASPVKTYALNQNLPVMQPSTLKDQRAVADIARLKPDVLIVAAYGLILPPAVLDIPRVACVNVHASLLPRWRGAAPIQNAILHGDRETGVCLMEMEAGLDTGPVFACTSTTIGTDETAGELHDRLAAMGGELLTSKLNAILANELRAVPQEASSATYAAKIEPADAAIDWEKPAGDIERMIRAFNPVPGARFKLNGEAIKCWKASAAQGGDGKVGRVLAAGKSGIDIGCGEGILRLLEIQRAGRKRVTAAEFSAQFSAQTDLVGQRLS